MLLLHGSASMYATHSNLNVSYTVGVMMGAVLAVQIADGIILGSSYVADAVALNDCSYCRGSFLWLDYLVRDSNSGFLMRACHANGAALLFCTMYAHICRSLNLGLPSKVSGRV